MYISGVQVSENIRKECFIAFFHNLGFQVSMKSFSFSIKAAFLKKKIEEGEEKEKEEEKEEEEKEGSQNEEIKESKEKCVAVCLCVQVITISALPEGIMCILSCYHKITN